MKRTVKMNGIAITVETDDAVSLKYVIAVLRAADAFNRKLGDATIDFLRKY